MNVASAARAILNSLQRNNFETIFERLQPQPPVLPFLDASAGPRSHRVRQRPCAGARAKRPSFPLRRRSRGSHRRDRDPMVRRSRDGARASVRRFFPTVAPALPTRVDEITVVSWNTALGEADVVAMVRHAAARPARSCCCCRRSIAAVPKCRARSGATPRTRATCRARRARPGAHEIDAVAAELGLSVYYVPSMRNGGAVRLGRRSRQRHSLEPPAHRPRRDRASVRAPAPRRDLGDDHRHHDRRRALARARRQRAPRQHRRARATAGLAGSTAARGRRAGSSRCCATTCRRCSAATSTRGLAPPSRPTSKRRRRFPRRACATRAPTFRGLLRLDHVFLRLAPGWVAEFRRGDERFGSDHYPLVGTLRFRP